MTISIHTAAMNLSMQDLGRKGYRRFGLPQSGPMDAWAFRCANRLVGNAKDCACLEIGFSSSLLQVERDALMAVCGAGYRLLVNDRPMPLWMAVLVKKGNWLSFEKCEGGNWAYLAVAGGFETPLWLGSRSTYPRAGLGRLLCDGDRLQLHPIDADARFFAGRMIPSDARPPYSAHPIVRVLPGPHLNRIDSASQKIFWEEPFRVSSRSDRMGYRLQGHALSHVDGADIVSQGMVMGEIQVPADGQPIVMMPDHPTTGGYTSIGIAARADLPLLAQAEIGKSEIHFVPITISEAQQALKEMMQKIKVPFPSKEDEWLLH